jgi:hypothetical protein
MPKTYTPISTTTTTTSTATSVTISSIPSTYTDLILSINAQSTGTSSIVFRVNGDGGTNYSGTQLWSNGSALGSQRLSSQTTAYLSYDGLASTNGAWGNLQIHFMNYSNTTTFKQIINRATAAPIGTDVNASLWRSTAAINSITIYSGGYFNTGCTFTLYGIKAA